MEWSQLIQFKKVAELEHITQASIQLAIAQPALSKTIRKLEEEFGLLLFDRVKKSIVLNENGKIVYQYVCRIEHAMRDMRKVCADVQDLHIQTISVLFETALGFFPRLIQSFHQQYPHIHFKLCMAGSRAMSDNSSFDFVLTASPKLGKEEENAVIIMEEALVLAVSKSHHLSERPHIALKEAARKQFITLSEGTQLYQSFLSYCQAAGFQPNIALSCNDYLTMEGLIEGNFGAAMVPEQSWGYQNNPNLNLIPISEPNCRNTIRLCWKKDTLLSPACRLFQEYIIHYCRENL